MYKRQPDQSLFVYTLDSLLFKYSAKGSWEKIFQGGLSELYTGLLPGRKHIWLQENDSVMTCIDYEGNVLTRITRRDVHGVHMLGLDKDENENCVFTETMRGFTPTSPGQKVMTANPDGLITNHPSAVFFPGDNAFIFTQGTNVYHMVSNWLSNPFNNDIWVLNPKGWWVIKTNGEFVQFLDESVLSDFPTISNSHVFFTAENLSLIHI